MRPQKQYTGRIIKKIMIVLSCPPEADQPWADIFVFVFGRTTMLVVSNWKLIA